MPGEPGSAAKHYRRHEVEGVMVFLHPDLVQVGSQVLISLGGFWKMRWLKVAGAGAMASCSLRPA